MNDADVKRFHARLEAELAALDAEDALGQDAQQMVTLDQTEAVAEFRTNRKVDRMAKEVIQNEETKELFA